ncbi:hypothetical protein JCM1840_001826 [Sporobolomyces johnsonii]
MLSSLLSSLTSAVHPSEPTTTPRTDPDPDPDPFLRSPYFQRLVARATHSPSRLAAIRAAALRAEPPVEPRPEACCNEACALDCVVTVWWEEEKTWRDLHPDWKSIKARLRAEEEDRRREQEEQEALDGGGGGGPDVEIEIAREETEDEVMESITSGFKGF